MRAFLVLMIVVVGGCELNKEIVPGDCNSILKCPAGNSCINNFCVAVDDGGLPIDGGGGAVGGMMPDAKVPDTMPAPECTSIQQCSDKNRPICDVGGKCRPCAAADCKGSLPFCSATGACAACLTSADCPTTLPICSAGACVACNAATAPADGCAKRDMAHAVCVPTGSVKVGQCVGCVDNTTCTATTKPICDVTGTNECRGCAADTECKSAPGVCMSHQDGRCATDAETIYVQKPCGATAGDGTAAAPLCSAQSVPTLLTPTRRLVIVRGSLDRFSWNLSGPQVTLIGQKVDEQSATISPGADVGIQITGGDFYGRGFSVTRGNGCAPLSCPGVLADGAMLRLDNVIVSDNLGGGIVLKNSGFELLHTTISRNGPGKFGSLFGGLIIQDPPATSPARLNLVSVTDNKQAGIVCSRAVQGTGVFTMGNQGGDIDPTCGFMSCTKGPEACGARE